MVNTDETSQIFQSNGKGYGAYGKIIYFWRIYIMEIAKMGERRKILTNSGWLFFDKIIRQGLNLLLTAYIARYLGASTFGEWNYAIAFVALFSFLSTFGLYNILLRDFVRSPEKAAEIIGTALSLRFIGGCLTMFFSVVVISLSKPDATLLTTLIFITSANYVAQSTDVIDYYFQSRLKSNWIAISRGISFIIFGIVKLLLVHHGFGIAYFAAAQACEFLLSGIILIFFLARALPLRTVIFNVVLVKRLIQDSAPILFSEIAILVYMRTDQVMIGEMIGDRALGNYSAAVKLSEIWYFIPGIICSSLFPSIVRAHSHNTQAYHHKLQQLYDLLSGISLSIAIVVSITSFFIIGILFGSDYRDASTVLTIHVWTGVFVFWGLASNQQLVIEGLTKLSLYRTIIGMIVNIVFNFLLIPIMGINGAAVATLLAQAFSAWISNVFFYQSRSIFWMTLRSLNPVRFITLAQIILKKGLP